MSNHIDEVQKIFDDNGVTDYNIKMENDVRKKGSVPRDTKKKLRWIIDDTIPDGEIIYIEYDDPRAFLHTDKTPEEVEAIVKQYMKATT